MNDELNTQVIASEIDELTAPAIVEVKDVSAYEGWEKSFNKRLGVTKEQISISDVEKLLSWEVEKRPLFGADAQGKLVSMPDNVGIFRGDYPLGVVGKNFSPISNRQIVDFTHKVLELDPDAKLSTAGILGEGRTVWTLIDCPKMRFTIGDESINSYMLISNGNVGNGNLCILPSVIRVICQNTLNLAKRKADDYNSGVFKIRHSSNAQDRIVAAEKSLEYSFACFEDAKKMIEQMAETKAPDDYIEKLVNHVFGKEPASAGGLTRYENRMTTILSNLNSMTSNTSTKGSIWNQTNALTEYLDHQVGFKNTENSDSDENKKFSNAFGLNPVMRSKKEAAFSYAMSLC